MDIRVSISEPPWDNFWPGGEKSVRGHMCADKDCSEDNFGKLPSLLTIFKTSLGGEGTHRQHPPLVPMPPQSHQCHASYLSPKPQSQAHFQGQECSSSACPGPPHLPSPLHPPHLGVRAEAAVLILEPRRGRRPPLAPRPAPQGGSCEKRAGKEGGDKKQRREERGGGEGDGESCAFLQAERASPRRGPSPRSCLPSPGPPTWQQQHRRLLLLRRHGGGSPASWLRPRSIGPCVGFRWETPMAPGCRASCKRR